MRIISPTEAIDIPSLASRSWPTVEEPIINREPCRCKPRADVANLSRLCWIHALVVKTISTVIRQPPQTIESNAIVHLCRIFLLP